MNLPETRQIYGNNVLCRFWSLPLQREGDWILGWRTGHPHKVSLQKVAATTLFLRAVPAEATCRQSMVAAFPFLHAPSVVAHGDCDDRR